jgi:tRNA(Ile)-lysidine synthase
MDRVHSRVSGFFAAQRIGRDTPLLVATSGGADSIALLHILASLGQRVGAAHVHHGLRGPEADRDQAFVRATAAQLGIPFFHERVDAARKDGQSPEARARTLRYEALERIRLERGYRATATAHTMEDQAETVLLRATRGVGPAGLAAIEPFERSRRIVRPLLGIHRFELRRYLERRGLPWREDETNGDLRVPRNRIRHCVLPELEAAHPGAIPALGRLADDARVLARWLDSEAERALGPVRRTPDGGLVVENLALARLPDPLRTAALAHLLGRAGLGHTVTRAHLRRVDRLVLRDGEGGRVSLPRGRMLVREGERLWLGDPRRLARSACPSRALIPPLPSELPERGVRFEWRRLEPPVRPAATPDVIRLPEPLSETLRVRGPDPGDRLRLVGDSRPRPLGELFRVAGWSSWERHSALVVTWRREVVWVVGLAASDLPTADRGGWELRAVWVSSAGATC